MMKMTAFLQVLANVCDVVFYSSLFKLKLLEAVLKNLYGQLLRRAMAAKCLESWKFGNLQQSSFYRIFVFFTS